MPEKIAVLPSNTFGIEFEMSYGRNDDDDYNDDLDQDSYEAPDHRVVARSLARALQRAGIGTEAGAYAGPSRAAALWNVKEDGSCGMEVTSPALSWDRENEVRVVARWLAYNYKVNENCGLHVHHHLPNLTVEELRRIWLSWAAFDDLFQLFVDLDRSHNSYCLPLAGVSERNNFTRLRRRAILTRFQDTVMQMDRFRTLNASGWWTHGRLEVRLHHGTLDADTVLDWVRFTQLFLHAARSGPKLTQLAEISALSLHDKFEALMTFLDDRVDLSVFSTLRPMLEKRIQRYHPRRQAEVLVAAV